MKPFCSRGLFAIVDYEGHAKYNKFSFLIEKISITESENDFLFVHHIHGLTTRAIDDSRISYREYSFHEKHMIFGDCK